jgi:hypothetical protein
VGINKLYDRALGIVPDSIPDPKAKVIGHLNRAFATEDGKAALRFIMELCEWNDVTTAADPKTGELNPLRTTWTAIRQDLYREIRRHLTNDILKDVEFFNGSTITEEP